MAEHFDVIVIGAGQAGPAMAARAGKEGRKTALIERAEMGGTCVNNGCVPTKTLVASARAAAMARRAADFGVMLDAPVRVDMQRVMARKDAVVQASRDGVESWMNGAKNVTVIRGHARFSGANTLEVAGRQLTAPQIFINVGARPVAPDIAGLDTLPYLDNIGMMRLDVVPEHLVIIGGSYIGLEFAQMMRRFGAQVTVCEQGPRLIGREDADVSLEVQAILEREGITVHLGATCLAVQSHGGRVHLTIACDKELPPVTGSHLLVATGRKPNTDDLGLHSAGIATDARGYISVNEQLETSVPGVYALGDVNGRGAFTHTAWNDYEIVSANLFDAATRRVTDRITTYALFIDPPLGRVGMSLAQAQASGRRLLVAKLPMSRVGRAREMGETQGFMKVIVDADSQRILGAAILGVSGDEVVQSLLEVMAADAPYSSITQGMHIHPTVCELLPTLLEALKPDGVTPL